MVADVTITDEMVERAAEAAIAALSRFTAPALPEDIAGLIKRLNRWFADENCGPVGPMRNDFKDAAAAIRAQAAEIERLTVIRPEILKAERDEARRQAIKEAKQAIVNVRFGPPSNWKARRPVGWHLDRPCAPEEAAMHDNGCIDAFMAISALAEKPQERPSQSDADLPTAEDVRGILKDGAEPFDHKDDCAIHTGAECSCF